MMPVIRSYHHSQFAITELATAKGGRRISVCLPARNEEATVGGIVAAIRQALPALVDEVVVADDGSADATAAEAARAGARVVRIETGPGKGQALRAATEASAGDLIAFCDADLRDFDPRFVVGLLGPLLLDDGLVFVKAFYERPLDGRPRGGGRVTELVAKPLILLLFPHLAPIRQPLSGEYAARRTVLAELPFDDGYGVDLGLLVDVAARFGVSAMAQVDLGIRVHRNRPLEELRPIATAVLETALRRAGIGPPAPAVHRPVTGPAAPAPPR